MDADILDLRPILGLDAEKWRKLGRRERFEPGSRLDLLEQAATVARRLLDDGDEHHRMELLYLLDRLNA